MVNDPSDGPGGISSFKSVTRDLHSQRRLLFFDLSAAASALAALQSDDAAFVVVVIVVVVGNVERSGRRAGLRLQREFGGGTGAGLSAVERFPCPAGGTLAVAALHLGVTGLRSSRRRAGGVRSPASVGAGGGTTRWFSSCLAALCYANLPKCRNIYGGHNHRGGASLTISLPGGVAWLEARRRAPPLLGELDFVMSGGDGPGAAQHGDGVAAAYGRL